MDKLKSFKEKIEKELELYFDKKIESDGKISEEVKEVLELLKEYTLRGGKRLRAATMYYAYKCFKEDKEKEIIKVCMAMELMQSYFLIHDDIMDRDDLRRGAATLHRKYAKLYENEKDSEHTGLSMAIIAGDLASTFAFEILTNAEFDEEIKIQTLHSFEEKELNTIYGQILDIFSHINKVDEKYINKLHKYKSVNYTAYAPLEIGATFAGASSEDMKLLSEYGTNIGMIFQLQDDLLDLFGDKTVGKDIASDIKEGKKTIFLLKALERATEEEEKFIESCLGNRDLNDKDAERLKQIIVKTGAYDYTKNLQKELAEKARSILENADFRQEGKDFLLELIDFLLERKS